MSRTTYPHPACEPPRIPPPPPGTVPTGSNPPDDDGHNAGERVMVEEAEPTTESDRLDGPCAEDGCRW